MGSEGSPIIIVHKEHELGHLCHLRDSLTGSPSLRCLPVDSHHELIHHELGMLRDLTQCILCTFQGYQIYSPWEQQDRVLG